MTSEEESKLAKFHTERDAQGVDLGSDPGVWVLPYPPTYLRMSTLTYSVPAKGDAVQLLKGAA